MSAYTIEQMRFALQRKYKQSAAWTNEMAELLTPLVNVPDDVWALQMQAKRLEHTLVRTQVELRTVKDILTKHNNNNI